jgi:hypothetical protein
MLKTNVAKVTELQVSDSQLGYVICKPSKVIGCGGKKYIAAFRIMNIARISVGPTPP